MPPPTKRTNTTPTMATAMARKTTAYEESQEPEKERPTIRGGFGQIGLDSNYTGARIDRFDMAPDLTGTYLPGAEPSGDTLWPAPEKAKSDNP